MAIGQQLSHWPRSVRALATGGMRDHRLAALLTMHTAAYTSFWLVMHLRSQSWATARVLDNIGWYWRWFYRLLISEERVVAARPSALAATHPWWMFASLVLLSVSYLLWLRWFSSARAGKMGLWSLLGIAALACLPLLALPNLQSGDIYSNIAFGRIAVVYGANPFTIPPAAFPGDLVSPYVNWKQVPSVYGPGWIYPSMLLTTLIGSIKQHIVAYVLGFKLFAIALHLCNGALIWLILGRWQAERQRFGTALYLLNPLVLIEFAGNAHNDVLMITFILLGIWTHQRGAWHLTLVAWTLATLCKWIALPLLPLYGILLLIKAQSWRVRAGRAASGVLIVAALGVGLYRPYWDGWNTFKVLVDAPPQQRLLNSLGEVVSLDVQRWMWWRGAWPQPALADPMTVFALPSVEDPLARTPERFEIQDQRESYLRDQSRFRLQQVIAKANRERVNAVIRYAALVLLALVCLIAAALVRSMRRVIGGATWILFTYCTIAAVWFWPWYVTWLVALAAFTDWRVTGRTMLLLSLLAPFIYVGFPDVPDPDWWQRYRAVIVFAPPLIFALWHAGRIVTVWLRSRRWSRSA